MPGLLKLDSTNTPLDAAGVYTSGNFPMNHFGQTDLFRGVVFSDAPFTVKVQQSNDNANWDCEILFRSEKNSNGYQCYFQFSRFGFYARWQIVNGATPMTVLRGQVNGVA